MDWQTIFASITASSAITAAIAYTLKKSFDHTLDLRFEKLKDQNKALINEEIRRRGFLYDKQFDALKKSLSLAYRLRNTIREAITHVESRDRKQISRHCTELSSLIEEIRKNMSDERVTLPDFLFREIHWLKNLTVDVYQQLKALSVRQSSRKREELASEKIKYSYAEVDNAYCSLAHEIQEYLGVSVEDSSFNTALEQQNKDSRKNR